MRCLPRTTNLQRGAGWGRAPPSRGGVAAFGPAGSALWGGPQPPPACFGGPAARSICGRRPAQSAFFASRSSPVRRVCGVGGGRWVVPAPPGGRPAAGRPRRCAALLPVAALSRLSPPPPAARPRRVPPLWRWAALRPWDGGGRPSPAPALCCARPGSPPGAWFFSPPPRGFVVPGPLFLCSCCGFRARRGARGPKNAENGAKMGEKRQKQVKIVAKPACRKYNKCG